MSTVRNFPAASPDRVTVDCPSWCMRDHRLVLDLELREHGVTLAEVPTVAARGGRASVDVEVCDDLDAGGVRGEPAIYVSADDGLTPAAARELARALLVGADLIEQGNRATGRPVGAWRRLVAAVARRLGLGVAR